MTDHRIVGLRPLRLGESLKFVDNGRDLVVWAKVFSPFNIIIIVWSGREKKLLAMTETDLAHETIEVGWLTEGYIVQS